MKAKAYVVHQLPGRVRFKIHGRRSDRRFFDDIERRLRRFPLVTGVRTDPVTGSVLVEHKSEIADLAKEALASDVGELVEFVPNSPPMAQRLRLEMASVDDAVQQFTGGEIDLGTLASLGLLAMAGVQLALGQLPPMAVSWGWYATELLRRSADAGARRRTD